MPRKKEFPIWVDEDGDTLTFERNGDGELLLLAGDDAIFCLSRNDALDILDLLNVWIEEEA